MKLRFWRRHDEIPVVELSRANPVRAGVILIVALAIVVYFGFTKKIPFKHGVHDPRRVRLRARTSTRNPRSASRA